VAVSRLARWVPLAAVVALLGMAMLATAFANPPIDVVPPPPVAGTNASNPLDQSAEPSGEVVPPPPPAQPRVDIPPGLAWALGGLCAVIVLAMVGVLIWLLVGERVGQRQDEMLEPESPPTDEETERTVRAAVDAGLAELDDADADPRRAVIACWVRLEAAAAAAGTERSPGDTSTELVSRLLARHYVSETVLSALAEVYREARFARHDVDQSTREQARTALRQLRDQLSAGARRGD
jgi:Domain of unknown function (DUF4129)